MGMPVATMGPEGFAGWLREKHAEGRRPVLFLGAGCSASSGIPTASGVVRQHIVPVLKTKGVLNDELVRHGFDASTLENAAGLLYGPLMRSLDGVERQRIVHDICAEKLPGFGYSVLGSLLASRRSPISDILTTNFDDLLSDACFLFGGRRPIVLADEKSAFEPNPDHPSPVLLKLHGDYLFHSRNTELETREIPAPVAREVEDLVRGRPLVFIGYGGNDPGIARMFGAFDATLDSGVYWVGPERPSGTVVAEWLDHRESDAATHWVKSSFDELMAWILKELKPPDPERLRIQEAVRQAVDASYRRLCDDVRGEIQRGVRAAARNPLRDARKLGSEAWGVEWRAERGSSADLWPVLSVYEENLREFASSPALRSSYAYFLARVVGDFDRAEEQYRRAVESAKGGDPQEFSICAAAYADFLWRWKDESPPHEQIEALFEEGLHGSPGPSPIAHSDYAHYLESRGRQTGGADPTLVARARDEHEAAVAIGPEATAHARAFARSNYAYFVEKHDDALRAEHLHEEAVDIDPDGALWHRNRATFQFRQGDAAAAIASMDRALACDPHLAVALCGKASLMIDAMTLDAKSVHDAQRDPELLEQIDDLFAAAVSADPMDAMSRCAYAAFLVKRDAWKADAMIDGCIAVARPQEISAMTGACALWQWLGDPVTGRSAAQRLAEVLAEHDRPDLLLDDFFMTRVDHLTGSGVRSRLQQEVIRAVYDGGNALQGRNIQLLRAGRWS